MRYISWVVALLEPCDVTNNGRHLGFYQDFYMKNNTKISTLILATRFTFIVERS